jgi:hypothetical protein
MEKGKMEVQTLPFYIIRITRPPSLLGSVYIVIGWLVQDSCRWGKDQEKEILVDEC